MKIFNFLLESKLDLRFYVKFDGEYDGDGPYRHKIQRIARQKDTDNQI